MCVHNNRGSIVVYADILYAYSHYLAHITRSQFEMAAGSMKDVLLSISGINERRCVSKSWIDDNIALQK